MDLAIPQRITLDKRTLALRAHSTDPVVVRKWIRELGASMRALPEADPKQLDVKHTFQDGMYMRELFIPAGVLLVGKIHKLPCLNIVSTGRLSLLTEFGARTVSAGFTAPSQPGIQKVGYALEDTVFINVFRTDVTDVALIDNVIAFDTLEEYANQGEH